MIKNIHQITEELYKQYDFNRLLRILQRFGSQRDEIKRNDSSDSEDEINITDQSINGKKRPMASVITTKRKRGNGVNNI
jgi:hypothetical protein